MKRLSIIEKTFAGNVSLRLIADGDIQFSSGRISALTGALDVILNSDHDGVDGGSIAIFAGSTIQSNGGVIVMGGGLDPFAAPAISSSSSDDGVLIDGAVMSSGGAITIRGSANAGSTGSGVIVGVKWFGRIGTGTDQRLRR